MKLIYTGKAKELYEGEDKNKLIVKFTDNATAGNNVKKAIFPSKGIINAEISAIIFAYLSKNGIKTHLIEATGDTHICQKCEQIPIEVIVRNKVAGTMAKKMGLNVGYTLSKPIFEISYKNDSLADPFINDDYAIALGMVSDEELTFIKKQALLINELLIEFFKKLEIDLVDFKLEFGRDDNHKVILIDEITPDTMRLLDKNGASLDKDTFRLDTGDLIVAYKEVLRRIKNV